MGGSNSSRQCKNKVRIERSLNQKEKEFVDMRRRTVQQSLEKLPIYYMNEVPNIALLGSGGGERAMVGLLGSLDQLDKAGLLDCILYLSGVSGSTWCMASLYQEPDWSTKLTTVKDKIIERLSGPGVGWKKAVSKMFKYLGKYFQSWTHSWAALVVTKYVKEINERTITEQWNPNSKDPFPIYTVIDKHCKQDENCDPWFEITPYEAGYSLIGAFVETSNFGCVFDGGCKIKKKPEIDMLYLQGLCGSAIADEEENKKFIWEKIKGSSGCKGLLDKMDSWLKNLKRRTTDALRPVLKPLKDVKRKTRWIWGRTYNFLHKIKHKAVPSALLKSETRDYVDAGLLLNSPYFSVLRKERNVKLIISLDFSDGDPFMTVRDAAEMSKKRNIPFPEVKIPDGHLERPKDFYVFKGPNAPTVIHIPLFNAVNCGDKIEDWRKKYKTFQGPYNAEMITDLMEVAGKNISNNRGKLLDEIRAIT